MQIYGFQKTTLLDYPGHVAATVFTGGCNFRCPFCHNARLVLGVENVEIEAEVLAYLKKRRGILQGVCITGGEPTLQPDLEAFIRKIKNLGYLVKLDTNGYRPEVLGKLLELGLPDYVAMDIKASKENYGRAVGVANLDITRIEESVELLKKSGIPYEFRTTVVKGIHSVEEFAAIGSWLEGCGAYYLQAFREGDDLLGLHNVNVSNEVASVEMLQTFSKGEMEQMAELAGNYIDKVALRGVE